MLVLFADAVKTQTWSIPKDRDDKALFHNTHFPGLCPVFFLGLFSSLAILDNLGRSWQVWSATGPAFPWWPEQRVSSSVTDSAGPAGSCWDLLGPEARHGSDCSFARPSSTSYAATALDLAISHHISPEGNYIILYHQSHSLPRDSSGGTIIVI